MTGWLLLAAAAAALALWGWRRSGSPTAFFAASRTAGPVVAGLAGTAAGLSAFVFVGGPSYFAAAGAASLWIILSAPLTGALQCWAVGEPIVELVRRHRCLTVPELLAARFGGGWPQGLAALSIAIGATATLAVQVKGAAVLGSALFDAPGWLVALAALVATVSYTAAGGMRSGLPAEAAQGAIMAVAAVAIAAAALLHAGGPRAAVAVIAARRPELLDPWGASGGTAAIGLFLLFGLGTCAQPHYLQKFLLLKDREALRWLPLVTTIALLCILTVWIGVGVGGTALFLDGAFELPSTDELTPKVLSALGRPWLLTLAMAGVIAAIMSTAASLLNIAAAAIARDLPAAVGRASSSGVAPARLATVAVGAAAAALALASDRPVVLLGVLGWGTFTAALLPVMVVGLNWGGCSRRGAVAALVIGPAVQLALEAARLAGAAGTPWEPGLTGAAAGTAALVVMSAGSRSTVARGAA